MALGSSDVYSPANPGLAQVLGSTLGPLRLMQQQAVLAQRERAAAARLKQQQEATDARNIVPLEANGWLPHNDELTAAVQAGYEKQKQIYADPTKSLFQKRAEAQQIASTLKQQADRSNELNARYKQTIGLASDPRYDKAALEAGAYGTFYQTDPDTGQRTAIPLAKYDPAALDNAATNPAFFNRDKVLQTFIKSQADSESVRLGKAAPPGGYGVNRQASSDIFDVNPDGTLAINADGSYKIRDINALVQRAHADPFMAAILRDNAAKAQQEAGASVMASYGQLTPEQNAALNGLQRTAPAEKADLATMLAPYGKTKASSVQTYRAPQRPSAAGRPKYVLNAPSEYAPGISGGEAARVPTQFSTFFNEPALQAPSSQRGLYSPARRPQPTYATATNPAKNFEFKGLPSNELLQPGPDGSLTHVRNNSQPIFGVPQEGVTLLRNRKTGELKHGADSEAGFTRQLRELGPDWKLEPAVQVAVPKNKNYAAESAQVMARLTAREAAKAENQEGYIPKTADQLEKEAFDLASGGTVQTYVPYNKATRGSIDGQTAGAYREYADKVVPQAEQRIRSSQPKPKANPLGFTVKAAPAAPKPKTVGKNNALGF